MATQTRFSSLLTGSSDGEIWNRRLMESANLVVAPTLGMIVPNWFLLIPKSHSFNFAEQPAFVVSEVEPLINVIKSKMDGADHILFEHGADRSDSVVGCGVDHAHLHLIFGSKSLLDTIWAAFQSDMNAPLLPNDLPGAFRIAGGGLPYYMAWRSGQSLVEVEPQKCSSQRLRKVISEASGLPNAWDYKTHAFIENIEATVSCFEGREALAA